MPSSRTYLITFFARIVLCVAMILPAAPGVALAAPTETPRTRPQPSASIAPHNQVACPAGPSNLPDLVDRTDFCVRYDDADTTNAQATQVADIVQQYWDRYVTDFSFRTPLFTDKLVVEIRNTASCNGATGPGVNDLFVNNGCFGTPESIQKVVGHELFHRVQYSYHGTEVKWFKEGTARAMEDNAFANIDNWATSLTAVSSSFNQQVNTYLNNTNVDITSIPQRYNSALWWKYFTEQFGTTPTEPQLGVDAFRVLWEAAETEDDIAALNLALNNLGAGTNFDTAFRRFAAANWIKDLANQPDGSFNYVDEDQAGNPALYGPVSPTNGGTINSGSPAPFLNQSISRYGAAYYSATPGANCPVVNATFHTDSGPAFYHVMTHKGATLDSHYESSATDWSRAFYNDGLTQIVAVAGSTNNSAQVDVTLQCLSPTIDIRMPNSGAVSQVGPHDGAGKFLAQVLVTDGDPKGPVISGLVVNDFKAKVGGENALITAGGFIQEQYWLVIQAPNQAADGTYDLEIRLEESGTTNVLASDVNTASVLYTPNLDDQVLVIDRSGSMSSDGKIQAAREAANFYIDITRNNDGLAIVPFDHDVNPPPFNMQAVDLTVRTNAHNFVNALSPGGLTSIGDGMKEAADQRVASPTGNPDCAYVLLSDGMENSPATWASVQADVLATGCPVTTIAFGAASDETLLQNIATTTGGAFFYNDVYVSSVSAAGVDAANGASAPDTALDLGSSYEYAQALSEGRQRLLDQRGIVPPTFDGPDPDRQHSVIIDGSVSEALFALKWSQQGCQEFCNQLTMKLRSPDGKEYTEQSIDFTFKDTYSGHLGWRIPNPTPGRWEIFVNHAQPQFEWGQVPYRVIVSAHSNLTAHLLLPAVQQLTGQTMPIFALVSGDGPIGNASVRALVTAPDKSQSLVQLYDDGEHDDGAAGDGFYVGVYKRVNQANPVPPAGEDIRQPEPRDEGSYRVQLLVSNGEFQREALGSFAVLESPDDNQNGLPDAYERENNLTNPDADNDLDGLENGSEYKLGTDPNDSDTDDGGENDGSEVEKRKDPFNPKDDRIREPQFLKAQADVNSVRLTFQARPDYRYMVLYRAETPSGPWSLRDAEVKPTGEYVDQEVKNGQPYFYQIMAVNGENNRSALVASQGATPSEDPFQPEAQILINNGAATTNNLLVRLTFVPYEDVEYFDDIVEMKLGNTRDLSNVEWRPFKPEVDWQLADTKAGEMAHVYGLFRDKAGNESLLETAMIRYEPSTASLPQICQPTKLTELPLDLHRKAAQFLEEMRGSPLAPGWDKAQLAEAASQLYRPDVEGVAYYEIGVVGEGGAQAGFIMLATGEHDFPIPHWNYEGETPTQNLARVAAEKDQKVAKCYKLDTLAYAGENENGDLVAMPGTQMVKVSGLDLSMLDKPQELSSAEYAPNKETASDEQAEGIEGTTTESGPTPPASLTMDGWESWQALKEGYKATYEVFAEALRREAAQDWQVDQLARDFGEGLFKGNTYDVTLLFAQSPQVRMTGEGAAEKYIGFEIVPQAGGPAILRIHVKDAEPGRELPLNAEIDYSAVQQAVSAASANNARAVQEVIKFTILDAESLPQNPENKPDQPQIFLPLVKNGGPTAQAADVQAAGAQAINGSWSNWTYHWAGTSNDQRLYDQIPQGTSPNSSNCWSGCGGTAWAMLFGWADKQAANGNAYWAPRWGLYRENGGKGANAVAPRNMDNGVRNMTWEIRNDVGTWCAFGSGPTNPWNMDDASNYFAGRTGTKLSTHYNVLGIQEGRLREYARNSIRDRNTPAIIGTGWLTHYPLAYGYAWRKRTVKKCFIFCWEETQYNRSFYVNQGWGGSGNGWVSAGTWFAGEIRP